MPKNEFPYEVGYGKPPESGRFPAGKSGNPKGRPKGSKNLSSMVLRAIREKVVVSGPRGKRTATKLEATLLQLANKASQGDLPSQRALLALVQQAEELERLRPARRDLSEIDRGVLENFQRRLSKLQPGPSSQLDERNLEDTK